MSRQKLRALVVDDEPEICNLFGAKIEQHYSVTTAPSPLKACTILDKMPFDLIITDLQMPILSGNELALRAREINPDIKIILMSGHICKEEMGDLSKLEPYLFLEKTSLSLNDTLRIIDEYVTKKEAS